VESPVARHQFSATLMRLFLRMVLTGVSLRAAARVLEILAQSEGWTRKLPTWTTGRMWLLRLGHFQLTRAKEQADDWVWLIDHSVQIGPQKCLAVVGFRLCQLPTRGACLRHEDLQLIALEPMRSSTKEAVRDRLEAACAATGVPRVIVDDRGADLTGGVRLFREKHPRTVEMHDWKHKAACLLKARLEREPRWRRFQTLVGQTRCAIQQTELAFLGPPGPKLKARFMNLRPMLDWAAKVLNVLREPSAVVRNEVGLPRLREKLGWVEEFAAALAEWREWQQLLDVAVEYVAKNGVEERSAENLKQPLLAALRHASSRQLADEFLAFAAAEASKVPLGERYPGSSEVLESLFGKFKVLEKQHAKAGFTGLILSFGALTAKMTTSTIQQSLKHSPTQAAWNWIRDKLGATFYSQRKQAFRPTFGATQTE
jgi:hypothetical protein